MSGQTVFHFVGKLICGIVDILLIAVTIAYALLLAGCSIALTFLPPYKWRGD